MLAPLTALEGISPGGLDLLTLMAVAEPQGQTDLLRLADAAGLRDDTRSWTGVRLKAVCELWAKRGLVEFTPRVIEREWLPHPAWFEPGKAPPDRSDPLDSAWRVTPELTAPLVADALRRDRLTYLLRFTIHQRMSRSGTGVPGGLAKPRLLLSLAEGDAQTTVHQLLTIQAHEARLPHDSHPLRDLLGGSLPAQFLSPLGHDEACLLRDALASHVLGFGLDGRGLEQWLRRGLEATDYRDDESLAWLAQMVFLRGDREVLLDLRARSLSDPGRWLTQAMISLLDGNTELAWDELERLRTGVRGGKVRPDAVLGGLPGILTVVMLWQRGDMSSLAEARRRAKALSKNPFLAWSATAQLLGAMVDCQLAGAQMKRSRVLDDWSDLREPLLLPLRVIARIDDAGLARISVQLARTLFTEAERYSSRGLAWLSAQCLSVGRVLQPEATQAALQRLSRPVLEHDSGLRLLAGHRVRAPWEQLLAAIDKALPNTDPENPEPELDHRERMTWRVQLGSGVVEPFLQMANTKGWSTGRKIALARMARGGELAASLAARDRAVADCMQLAPPTGWSNQPEYILEARALIALVGHPFVFDAHNPDRQLHVRRGEVSLRLLRVPGGISLKIEPPGVSDTLSFTEEGDTLTVYCLTAKQQALALACNSSITIPDDGKEQTLALLERVASVLPVQSELATNVREQPCDSSLHLRLIPRGVGLSITTLVRPLGPQTSAQSPGNGEPILLGRVGEEQIQTRRALEEESKILASFVTGCLLDFEGGPFEWELPGPEQCLEFLSAMRAHRPPPQVEWPQGKHFELRGRATRRHLKGTLSRAGSWFEAKGTLKTEGLDETELHELLTLLPAGTSRFIQLPDGSYLELERELASLLRALHDAGEPSGKGKQRSIRLGMGALVTLDQLTAADSGLELDGATFNLRTDFEKALAKKHAVPRPLQAELREYQSEGFRWLARMSGMGLGAILADDMGLGKTVQLLALLLLRRSNGPALVIAPTSVCQNWLDETARFAPTLTALLYTGGDRESVLQDVKAGTLIVCSYALMQQDAAAFAAVTWGTAILDEAQFIKNAETQRAQAAFSLNAGMRVAATGTPVENQLGDLWSLMHFAEPSVLGSWGHFRRRFASATLDDNIVEERRRLRRLIGPFILRRTKAQVLSDLPPLTEIRHTVEMTADERKLYDAVRHRALQQLAGEKRGTEQTSRIQVLAELTRLRRLCCSPSLVKDGAPAIGSKLAAFLELVDEIRESNHRALVFSQFVDVLTLASAALDERGISYEYLDGSTPARQRAERVESFQSGHGDLFLISLKAGGFGLNLTGADYVIHLDPWWNPAVEEQASGRAHRIGQERPVTVYRLVTAGTVEERIVDLHHRKRDLADQLLEGAAETARLSAEDLLDLLQA